jgi:hypothetical protein
LEIHLGEIQTHLAFYSGSLVVGDRLRGLPVGSTFDKKRGVFYWQPGLGFVGNYSFAFIKEDVNGEMKRKNIVVRISARSSIKRFSD